MALSCALSLQRPAFRLQLEGEFGPGVHALLGPSGAGKTSLLRCIAGLERARGRLAWCDTRWLDGEAGLPPHRRQLGLVSQLPALFPHLDVAGNLRYAAPSADDGYARRRAELCELLELAPLLARRVGELSGGEARRVALARALLRGSRLLLLDEPCSGLDDRNRRNWLAHLGALVRRYGLTVLYVSHDLEEVAGLADTALLLTQGRVLARGAFDEVVTRLDLPPAQDARALSVLQGTVQGWLQDDALRQIEVGGRTLLVPGERIASGAGVRIVLPATAVALSRSEAPTGSVLNALPVTVQAVADAGPGQVLIRLRCGGGWLLARLTARSARTLGLAPGVSAYAHVKAVALHES